MNNNMRLKPKKIGAVNGIVINKLNLSIKENTPIFISETNIEHMKSRHPEDYEKYGDKLVDIISNPDYLALHPNNGSIQYIKVFYDEAKEERVLVAVRTSKKGTIYARSLFVMSDEKVERYEEKNAFKEYK